MTRVAESRSWFPRPARHTLLFGDWTPWIRDGIDVLRLAFIAGTVVFWLMGRSTAVGLTAACIVLLIARVVGLPRPFDLALIVAMTIIAYGTAFDLYGRIPHYDKFVHGLSPLLWSPVLYIVLVRLDVLPELGDDHETHHFVGIFIVTLAIGLAVGAGYEIVEWTLDLLFPHWHLVKGETDTATDLIADACGASAGGVFLVIWASWGWGTVRREPPASVP